jgi:hypothetical protein
MSFRSFNSDLLDIILSFYISTFKEIFDFALIDKNLNRLLRNSKDEDLQRAIVNRIGFKCMKELIFKEFRLPAEEFLYILGKTRSSICGGMALQAVTFRKTVYDCQTDLDIYVDLTLRRSFSYNLSSIVFTEFLLRNSYKLMRTSVIVNCLKYNTVGDRPFSDNEEGYGAPCASYISEIKTFVSLESNSRGHFKHIQIISLKDRNICTTTNVIGLFDLTVCQVAFTVKRKINYQVDGYSPNFHIMYPSDIANKVLTINPEYSHKLSLLRFNLQISEVLTDEIKRNLTNQLKLRIQKYMSRNFNLNQSTSNYFLLPESLQTMFNF